MNQSFRVAYPEDELNIIDCVNASYLKYIDRIGKKPAPMLDDYSMKISNNWVHVIEQQNSIIGMVVLIPKPNHACLENIAVRPSFQGQGLGRQLMLYAESITKSNGLNEIRLFTNEAMYENLVIYLKLGYLETERKTEDGYKRVYFSKKLL